MKATKYPQSAVAAPVVYGKAPGRSVSNRRLHGFFRPTPPSVCKTLDAYDAGPEPMAQAFVMSPAWNRRPTKRFAAK